MLSAGGGHPNGSGEPGEFSAQTYSPPYLFDGPRPTISSAPTASTYNTSITVSTPDAASISAVNLVSLGTDTHQGDQAQHFVPLSFTASSGSLTVQTPANSALAPYGNYMLFIVNSKGVPSVSAPLNLSAAPAAPAAPTEVKATASAGQRNRDVDRPFAGDEPDHLLHRHALRRLDGADAHDGERLPAGHERDDHRPDERHRLHVHRVRDQRRRDRARVDGLERRDALRAHRPGGAECPHCDPGQCERDGDVECAREQRQPDHELYGHAVRRLDCADAYDDHGLPTGDERDGHRPDERHHLHVHGVRDQRRRHRARLGGLNAVTPTATTAPAFVQQVSGHAHKVASLAVTPAGSLTAGNRLVVEVGVWSSASATASSVKDSAGDTFTELLHFKASDGTELSVWSAPVSAGGGTRPTITATPSATADVGVAALEYSGLSTAAGTAVVDQTAQATGKTTAAAVVATGATAPTTGPDELVLGLYADSGFDDALMARMGFNGRVNVSPTEEMELVAEDALTGATGATPSASVQTGASTVWLMATVVLKPAPAAEPPAAPAAAPALLVATPGNRSATVTWRAPPNGGSPITTYTVTTYRGSRWLKHEHGLGHERLVGGLRNGVRYRFTVAARNALGTGPTSAFTNTTRPSASLVWAFWCTALPMETMHLGALGIAAPWAGERLLPGNRAKSAPGTSR